MSRHFQFRLPHELLDIGGDLSELLGGVRLVGLAHGPLLTLHLQHVHLLEGLLQEVQHLYGVIRCEQGGQSAGDTRWQISGKMSGNARKQW